MKLYADIRLTEPVSPEGPFPSVGGFEVRLSDGREIGFDFLESEYEIDADDPCVLHVICSHEDTASFPDVAELRTRIADIEEITDFYVDMEAFLDEGRATEFRAVRSIVIESDPAPDAVSNEYVTVQPICADFWEYAFTERLLATCVHCEANAPYNRCRDCAALTCDDDGGWLCEEAGTPCNRVKDCPEGLVL